MKKAYISLVCILTLLNSCAWLHESEHQKIAGEYEVGWNDIESNRAITKPIENFDGGYHIIVDGYVYAVGHNENYIIAKQHQSFETETNYYLIDIKKNSKDHSKGIYGPLNKIEFEKIKKELNIQSINFDLNFNEKPNN